jgi:hypothetical protein
MKNTLLIVGATAALSLAYASDQAVWPAPYRPFTGHYTIYSGDMGEQQAPMRDDRKLSFVIEGQPAKEIFDSMYPDDKETCGGAGARGRTKGNAWCTYHPKRGYRCYFGYDLRTGKSIGGGMC